MAFAWKNAGARDVSLALSGAGVVALIISGSAAADSPQRYPYDPVCAWGRVADGHGMLIRCLDPKEASLLLQATDAPSARAAASQSEAERPGGSSQKIAITEVGPVVADTGELPLAASKLSLAKDRYVDCAQKHGGLSAERAQVVVRFLVRERGRAEGVSVKSHKGLSQAAAKCVADVVDRRYVGYPAAPIVGATIPIELSVKR